MLGGVALLHSLRLAQLACPTWLLAADGFGSFFMWTWTGVFSSTWTCKGGVEERSFMVRFWQAGEDNTKKVDLWMSKLA